MLGGSHRNKNLNRGLSESSLISEKARSWSNSPFFMSNSFTLVCSGKGRDCNESDSFSKVLEPEDEARDPVCAGQDAISAKTHPSHQHFWRRSLSTIVCTLPIDTLRWAELIKWSETRGRGSILWPLQTEKCFLLGSHHRPPFSHGWPYYSHIKCAHILFRFEI